jgi:hypothetical protein
VERIRKPEDLDPRGGEIREGLEEPWFEDMDGVGFKEETSRGCFSRNPGGFSKANKQENE